MSDSSAIERGATVAGSAAGERIEPKRRVIICSCEECHPELHYGPEADPQDRRKKETRK